jgi:arginine N-succinyltransferase
VLLLRDVRKSDLPRLRSLAQVLNSVNLPADERALAGIVERSVRSFAGRIADPLRRSYVFVLEDPRRGRVLGTSMVIAQHGTRESPCTFLDVTERENYSSTLDRHFRHQVLSIGFHFDGPTEIGGLVVDPRARGGPEQPGKQLSLVRFLYMAMFPDRFRDTVLAELMPPLAKDGKSQFWESFGRRFTGLDYQDADKRSRRGKEFIQQLFPGGEFYATLLPPRVQRALGKVGRSTEPARRMLARIGFRYVNRIDPFDGGPHYEAKLAEITVVRGHRRLEVAAEPLEAGRGDPEVLAGLLRTSGTNRFRAVRTRARVSGRRVRIPDAAARALGVTEGDEIDLVPFG